MATRIESLAGLEKGHLSLQDFEWEPHMRPSSAPAHPACVLSIPEVDLQALHAKLHSPLERPAEEYANLVSAVARAASSVGFFQVYNHGICLSALEALHAYARRFFSLPFERKYDVAAELQALHASPDATVYISGSPAGSPNMWWCEAIRVASSNKDVVRSLAQCLCSDEHEQQAFSEILEECSNGFAKLAKDLTMVLLEGLGLNGHEVVENYIGGEIAGLKLSHYPPCPQPNMTLGLPPHSDVSILTLLWQDLVGGLQVRINGEWITVEPRCDALVVNIGDIFQIWSNDHCVSGLHRVILNVQESRYSIAYFYYPGLDSMLIPIPELLAKTNKSSKFRSILMSEHKSYVYAQVFKKGSEGVGYLRC